MRADALLLNMNSRKGIGLWLRFFAAAAVALFILLLPFIVRGNHLIWAVREADGATQHLTFFAYLREVGWFRAVGSYDFQLGLGMDFLTAMSFMSLFDPFNVFVFILPFDVVWVYDIVIVLKFFAAGAAMLAYLRFRKVKGGYAVACSLLYMLCGYVVFTFARHLNLTSGAIYLPLMAMGLEMAYRRQNPFVLIGFSFLCLVNSFYMFFFNSVFVVLYAFAYHGEACRAEGKKYFKTLVPSLWRVAVFYLIAIFLAGFMLLPNAYAYLHAARGGSKGLDFFDLKTLLMELVSFIAPVSAPNYSPLMLNLASLILCMAAFLFPSKKTFAYRTVTAVFAVGFVVPLFGWAMNIFNYSNNRWVYILSFCVFSLLALQSEERGDREYSVPERRRIVKAMCVYLGILALLGCAFGVRTCAESGLPAWAKGVLIALILIALAAVAAAEWFAFSPKHSFFADKKTADGAVPPKILDNRAVRALAKPNVLQALSVPLALLLALYFYIGYSAQHTGAALYRSLFSAEEAYVSEQNRTEFFRTDGGAADTWWSGFSNRGVNNGYMSTSLYNSMNAEEPYAFSVQNQIYSPPGNLGMSGLDDRPALQSLLSVRYYYGDAGYGFSPVAGFSDLYEYEYYVPFGFVYENTVSRRYLDSLDPLSRQYAMLSAMAVEGEGSEKSADAGALVPLDASFSSGEAEGFSLSRGETVRIALKGCAGKEIYVRLSGAAEVDENTEFSVSGNGKTRTYRFTPRGSNMYRDVRDACVCLGVSDADELTVTLSLLSGGGISFDRAEFLGHDAARTVRAAEALQARPHLENVEWGDDFVSGSVALEEAGWMFFSLPYSKGWSAYVDGEKEELIRANIGFMAVAVPEGGHEILLEYKTPWLTAGCVLSAAGGAAFLAAAAAWAVSAARAGKKKEAQ